MQSPSSLSSTSVSVLSPSLPLLSFLSFSFSFPEPNDAFSSYFLLLREESPVKDPLKKARLDEWSEFEEMAYLLSSDPLESIARRASRDFKKTVFFSSISLLLYLLPPSFSLPPPPVSLAFFLLDFPLFRYHPYLEQPLCPVFS